jgi:phage terminase large subunit-like protein
VSVIPDILVRTPSNLERLAYERHESDLALTRQSGGHPKGFYYDESAAGHVVAWIEKYCRHHKGEWAGRPLLLEPWQKFIVGSLFGWKRADGTRRFRKAWIEIPRKNGKTELAAAIGLYLLVGDNEPGAEVYMTATKKEQALICHEASRGIVRQSPTLRRFVHVPRSKKSNLVCERLGAKLEVLASDYGSLDGLSPHGDIRDEVHAWTDHGLAAVLNTAMGARRQPLTLEITTAGTYDPDGVGWQHHDYAVQVLERAFEDERQFSFITGLDEGDDAWDARSWAKANPNLGVSLKMQYVKEQAEEARHNPRLANDFLRLHCNRWTQQVKRWLNIERWNECPTEPLDLNALTTTPCFGGLDLSKTTDLTAFVLIFILPDGLGLLPRFWIPTSKLDEERDRGERRYFDWVERGFITATPGDVVDYAFIREEVKRLGQRFRGIKDIGFDPYNATQIATELQSDGFSMVEVRQGPPSLSEACKLFERQILARKVFCGGNPVMGWCVSNAVVREDANGNIAPDKARAKSKIDGVSATVTGLARYVVAPHARKSVYETRGFKCLG